MNGHFDTYVGLSNGNLEKGDLTTYYGKQEHAISDGYG